MHPLSSNTRASMISWPTTNCLFSSGFRSSSGMVCQGMYCSATGDAAGWLKVGLARACGFVLDRGFDFNFDFDFGISSFGNFDVDPKTYPPRCGYLVRLHFREPSGPPDIRYSQKWRSRFARCRTRLRRFDPSLQLRRSSLAFRARGNGLLRPELPDPPICHTQPMQLDSKPNDKK